MSKIGSMFNRAVAEIAEAHRERDAAIEDARKRGRRISMQRRALATRAAEVEELRSKHAAEVEELESKYDDLMGECRDVSGRLDKAERIVERDKRGVACARALLMDLDPLCRRIQDKIPIDIEWLAKRLAMEVARLRKP